MYICGFMRREDIFDVYLSLATVITDALAVFGGFMLATWLRFDSGWFFVPFGIPPGMYGIYAAGAGIATLPALFIFASLGLYIRPQLGSFGDKIPRLVRGTGLAILLSTVLAFLAKNFFFQFSSGVLLLSFPAATLCVLVERYLLFRIELNMAARMTPDNRILIIGTGPVAAHLQRAISREVRLRSTIAGFLQSGAEPPEPTIPPDRILGRAEDLPALIARGEKINVIILTDPRMEHDRTVEIVALCEQNLISFKLVPDIFRILTSSVDVQTIDDIPLLGVGKWPLDFVWNRAAKRAEDIVCGSIGMVLAVPLITVAAILIKRSSPGPVMYRQQRCGKNGRVFTLYKLRTMRTDAEISTGPVWAAKNDPRRTNIGAFLRRHNLDELPQFWNVLKGEMSLVGPRPERPEFVEQFKEEIARYMSRHMSKPGLTGWAQVNGLRGNTSLTERIKYDLYYLENWSLAFDFKIMIRTLFAHENAY